MRKVLFLLIFAPLSLFGQLEHAREVTRTLCSPEFHGRGYVNGGDSIAAEFIRSEFEKAGCKFFGAGAFQSFSFDVNTFPANMNVAINGKTLKPGIDYIVDPSSGEGKIDHLKGYKMPVTALLDKNQLALEVEALQRRKRSGDIPVILIHTMGLKGDSLKTVNKMAVGLTKNFAVIEITDAKFTWSVSDEQYLNPLIHVQNNALDVSDDYFIDCDIDAKVISHNARNIIAYAPAKRKSKKYIVFTAHYDHLGRMGQDTYFPGGNDNASGTSMLLELARYFVEHPMKNANVVFMSFAGEEAGLIGSHYYTEHPVFPLEKIRFLTNVDIMGSGEEGITVVNATVFPKAFEALQNINKKKEYLVKIGSRGKAANSDHYFFTENGVPAFFIYTMGPNKHYHDVLDTYEELSFSEFGDIYQLLIDFAQKLPKKVM